jgi:SET domain-containing protein
MHRDGSRAARELAMLERIDVRESLVHGKGVFARSRLRKGQRVGRFEGESTTRNGTYVLWLIDEEGREFGIRGRNALRFLNHGRPANAEFRDDELFAIRNVQPGDELLIDYGEAYTD